MLNNKGFAVSAVLYTLLVAFLLFLGVALASFSSSTSIIGNSNSDLVNNRKFEAKQIKIKDASNWYDSGIIVRINSRYGTMYWPKDFGYKVNNGILSDGRVENNNIRIECFKNGASTSCNGLDLKIQETGSNPASYGKVKVIDALNPSNTADITLYNVYE